MQSPIHWVHVQWNHNYQMPVKIKLRLPIIVSLPLWECIYRPWLLTITYWLIDLKLASQPEVPGWLVPSSLTRILLPLGLPFNSGEQDWSIEVQSCLELLHLYAINAAMEPFPGTNLLVINLMTRSNVVSIVYVSFSIHINLHVILWWSPHSISAIIPISKNYIWHR